ncbi:GPI-anchored surface protein, putative [Bodo saltans]|uniref:GPI-anchored surface protein, putative n=1 Tax=Bodo saltans TaxID=75058 RepID=A0A0S4J5D4_BODSA|nr:GPI-anchored surface protein, putative [Bodo saltans]|eukprot:CUG81764.1 GPI-anchored surface protein, putative [Bodo saltans]
MVTKSCFVITTISFVFSEGGACSHQHLESRCGKEQVCLDHRQYLDTRQLHNTEAYAAEHCTLSSFKVNYKHKMETKHSDLAIEYIRIPSITSNRSGVVLFFHGCGHSARDFCAPSAQCENCLGLAEEMHYVHQALANGFEVVAVSSPNRGSHCWAEKKNLPYVKTAWALQRRRITFTKPWPMDFEVLAVSSPNRGSHCWAASRIVRPDPEWMWNNRDMHAVLQVLTRENILGRTVPIIAVGASSGGSVLATLPAILGAQLYAVVSQIAAPTFAAGHRPQVVVYDLMSRDSPLIERATKEQMSLTGGRCSLRTRLLAANPRTMRKRWTPLVRAVLQKHTDLATLPEERRLLSDSLAPDASIIAEQMNVFYAQHEFFADHAFGNLRFIALSPSVIG